MNGNEAASALADVERTQGRLAERARWPFHRHAMFGLGEGLLVTAASQPFGSGLPMVGVAFALFGVCIYDDRRRHGMFVSGWRPGATRPLTVALVLFLLGMVALALSVRDEVSAQPLGYLVGAVAFLVCTAVSIRWERIYRAELAAAAGR